LTFLVLTGNRVLYATLFLANYFTAWPVDWKT